MIFRDDTMNTQTLTCLLPLRLFYIPVFAFSNPAEVGMVKTVGIF